MDEAPAREGKSGKENAPRSGQRQGQSLAHSFKCAFAGIGRVLFFERNAQIEVSVAFLVGMAAGLFLITGWQLVALLICIFGVLSLEIANSALEAVVDLASPDYHPLAMRAKDAAAGAVLMATLGSVVIGCVIFGPKLLHIGSYVTRMVTVQISVSYVLYDVCLLLLCVYVFTINLLHLRLRSLGGKSQESDKNVNDR